MNEEGNLQGMKTVQTNMKVSDIAQKVLTLMGQPYSLKDYPMFEDIYNSKATRIVMRAGRQVSKTVTEAGRLVMDTTLRPYTPVIYCNASANQTHSFSTSKLGPFLMQSPYIYHNFMKGPEVTNNVYHKMLRNYSEIIMSYFSESADRVRGRSGNSMYLDEVQDMLWEAMIDAQECLSAAPEPHFLYAGTSKSDITPLEFLWKQSNQKAWIIKCEGCGTWNIPDRKCIGKQGLICKKCGKPLNTYTGHWHALNPPAEGKELYADGYWIPQIIMPMHCCRENKWNDLLTKMETYPDIKFDNEVLGIPNGEGESPITEEILRKACIESLPCTDGITKQNSANAKYFAAGIDWGGGGSAGVSRTVLSIYAVDPEAPLFTKVYGKIYDDGEPARHVRDIANHLVRFHVHLCCGDHGGGNFAMSQLREVTPPSTRIVPVMYSAASAPCTWDERAKRYTVNRTVMIDNFFTDLMQGKVRTFRWEEFKPFAQDILNIRQVIIGEEHGKGQRVWRHRPDAPDDSLHSMVFGWLACRVLSLRMNFTI